MCFSIAKIDGKCYVKTKEFRDKIFRFSVLTERNNHVVPEICLCLQEILDSSVSSPSKHGNFYVLLKMMSQYDRFHCC